MGTTVLALPRAEASSAVASDGLDHTIYSTGLECLFADPLGDLAVLGRPDNQELSEASDL